MAVFVYPHRGPVVVYSIQ